MTMQAATPAPAAPSASVDPIEAALARALDGPLDENVVEKPSSSRRDVEDAPAKPKPKPKEKPKLEPEPEVDDDENEPPDEAATADEGDEASDESADDEQDSSEPVRGSKENPYTVKDLPKDVFFELKIDGKKEIVTAEELGRSYVGEQTTARRLTQTQNLAQRAEEYVKKASEFPKQFQQNFQAFTMDPASMFGHFFGVEPHEIPALKSFMSMKPPTTKAEAAERFAEMTAHMLINERKQPGSREQREAMVERRRVEAERERFEEQKRTEQQQREQQAANERARAIFDPGWADGLKRAGFPQLTKDSAQKLHEEVIVRIKQRLSMSQQSITPDDVAEFTVRSIRTLQESGVIPRGGKQKPKPVAPMFGREPQPQSTPNGQRPAARGKPGSKDWDALPAHRRANDPDFLLRNVSSKAFVRR